MDRRPSRSVRLKKYATIYQEVCKKTEAPIPVPAKPSKTVANQTKKTSQTKTSQLNAYQEFVRAESKKPKYKEMKGKERLVAIASVWKRRNKAKC